MDPRTERVLLFCEAAAAADKKRARSEESPSTVVTSFPTDADNEGGGTALDFLESKTIRSLLSTTKQEESTVEKEVFNYESGIAFLTRVAIDCTRLALREDSMKKFVDSSFDNVEDKKMTGFAIYACILDRMTCSFFGTSYKFDAVKLLKSTAQISKYLGNSRVCEPSEAAVKAARTTYRVLSASLETGSGLEQFAIDVEKAVSASNSVAIFQSGATQGSCKLLKLRRNF
jgi:hypothetical protein